MKSVVENDDSSTQENSLMLESSTSSSSQDLFAEFQTRSGRHLKAVEPYSCPIHNFDNVSFVEFFSCEDVLNFFEEIKKSEPRDNGIAAMTEEFKFFKF